MAPASAQQPQQQQAGGQQLSASQTSSPSLVAGASVNQPSVTAAAAASLYNLEASKSTKGASKLRRDLINIEITQLRDRIRQRFNEGYEPAVDYQTLSEAVQIDTAIRTWKTSHSSESANWCLAQLYRQTTWVYLYRTIRPSRPSEKIAQVVDDGLSFLDQLPQDAGAYSIVLMPLFLLGCSAFLPRQRERIKKGFETLKGYSNLRNIEPAFKVVQRVWEVMDTRMEDSWDWERIIKEMNMDFLIT